MESNYVRAKLEQIKREGYGLHLEEILSNAFDIQKKSILPGFAATFLYLVVMLVIGLSMFGTLYGMSIGEFMELIQRNPEALEASMGQISMTSMLIYSIISALGAALIAPLLSGLYQVAFNTEYGKNGSINDLFVYYKQPYFLNIFIYSFILAFVLQFVNMAMGQFLPGFGAVISILLQIILGVTLIFTIPFIVFGNFSWTEALQASVSVTTKNWFFLLFVLAISVIISFLGLIFCGIGILLTYPFIYMATFVLYDKIIGFPGVHDNISKIGEE